MTIQYGTSACERIICRTPVRQRVAFAMQNPDDGTETVYALHPVTREIRVRTGRAGEDGMEAGAWREAHCIPIGAAYVGRCGRPSERARITFVN